MLHWFYNTTVTVKRRANATPLSGASGAITVASRDIFNNPVYGAPATWTAVYSAMPCRLAFKDRGVQFAPTGERIQPTGTLYYPAEYNLYQEDRIVTADGIEYVLTGINDAYLTPTTLSHHEGELSLP
jgi:hypothetical protein